MNRICVYFHLLHPDYPWSVGKCRHVYLPFTDEGMHKAEAIVSHVRGRDSRLRAFWRCCV